MRRFWRGLRPDHLGGQIAILVLASIVLFHVCVTIVVQLFHYERTFREDRVYREERAPHSHGASIETAAALAWAFDLAPVDEREQLLATLGDLSRGPRPELAAERPPAAQTARAEPSPGALRTRLWPGAEIFASAPDGHSVTVALRKGGYLTLTPPPREMRREGFRDGGPRGPPPGGDFPGAQPPPQSSLAPPPDLPPLTGIWLGSALLFLICAAILTFWTSSAVVAPLVALARQAEKFPSDSGECELLVEKGPQEVRDLTRSLNRMQARIYSMIAARSRVLAAISHDLRTIITRMRLRAEFIDDEPLRAKMLHDVDLMDSMLYKNLLFLREERYRHTQEIVDLDSVLQTVADQFADLGHDVAYEGDGRRMVIGSLTDLQRVFANLVENAVAHGRSIVISVAQTAEDGVQIDVADDGPGIPDAEKAQVVEPFVRGQPGRNLNEHGGFGLGLSIVRALVEEAGGTLRLLDREPHGLVARVTLRPAEKATAEVAAA
ncbi:HAMP domain-containing histidine kinase [Methylosinus sp. H3A]|uniref:sensor histidine kinase n=1 Tax=Methylosinus sp. H3A TaxID=2785786 RepID=UPI0018C29BDA|nr:HAMP domain-containing sensor histidine kinase [Methylosinus sp. H3A]MBG0810499.1 HAMP domain-containing histidine kinase [Methylosinus sp. H3A]